MAVKDPSAKVPNWMIAIGWAVAFASFLCFGVAKPEGASMFDKMMDTGRTLPGWNLGLLRAALGLNLVASLTAMVAMVLNVGRPGRRDSQTMGGLLIALCVVGLVVVVMRLSSL